MGLEVNVKGRTTETNVELAVTQLGHVNHGRHSHAGKAQVHCAAHPGKGHCLVPSNHINGGCPEAAFTGTQVG